VASDIGEPDCGARHALGAEWTGEPDCGARHALARSDILGGDVCGRCGFPLGRMRRNCGLAPAELAFEDMPRAAVRFTYFAKNTGTDTCADPDADAGTATVTVPALLVFGFGPC